MKTAAVGKAENSFIWIFDRKNSRNFTSRRLKEKKRQRQKDVNVPLEKKEMYLEREKENIQKG